MAKAFYVEHIEVRDGYLYWSDNFWTNAGGAMVRVPIGGSKTQSLPVAKPIKRFDVSGDFVFGIDQTGIAALSFADGSLHAYADGRVTALAVGNRSVFWVSDLNGEQRIFRRTIEGGPLELETSSAIRVSPDSELLIDETSAYWHDGRTIFGHTLSSDG